MFTQNQERHGQPHILCVLLAVMVWVMAMPAKGDVSNPEYTYTMFYPKYAKGLQPTAFDVGKFDTVNLYNGGLSLTIPLGTPLHASADLDWQIVLHNSSKFWSWNKRDTGADCEGQGYVVGDAYAGIGWTMKLPHIHLRQEYDPVSETWEFFLDSVITSDGARHQLRRCLEGWDCRNGAPQPELVDGEFREYWYAADDSGWRVYRAGSDQQFPSLTTTRIFVAEHGGNRYTFGRRHLLDSGELGDTHRTDTDFQSLTRGWYCERIESISWPGPKIDVTYTGQTAGSPIPSTISAYDVAGHLSGRVVVDIDPGFHTIAAVRFLDAFLVERMRYSFTFERDRRLRIRASDEAGWAFSCTTDPNRRLYTESFSYLTSLRMLGRDGQLLSWRFGTFQEGADPPGEPDGEIDAEPKGRVRNLTLPTGGRVEYDYDQWIFYYPALLSTAPGAPGPILIDTAFCEPPLGESSIGPDPAPDGEMYSTRQKVWAVVDRKVVDTDNRLLEWTEYLREALGALVNYSEPFFDFSNTKLSSPDGGPSLLPDPIADPNYSDYFYSGLAGTVVRRHLVVDHEPGDAGEDIEGLAAGEGLVIDLPSARFDDTFHIFSTGRFFYDSDHDGYPSLVGSVGQVTDLYGTLPLEGRLLEVRHYRGPYVIDAEPPWYCAVESSPRLQKLISFDYTLNREDSSPLNGEYVRSCGGPLGGFEQYCGSRQESVRPRRETIKHVSASLLEDADDVFADPLFSGSEHWYESDDDCQQTSECEFDWRRAYDFSEKIDSPRFSFNEVLGVTTTEFTESAPSGTDFDLHSITAFDKTFTTSHWLPTLIAERVTTLDEPGSFDRTSTSYGTRGAVEVTRHHVTLDGESSGDVVTSIDYFDSPASGTVFGYGTPRVVSVRKVGESLAEAAYVEGTTFSETGGTPYVAPFVVEAWQLCPEGGKDFGRCPGWRPAPTVLGGRSGELKKRRSIDPYFRLPTSVVDGNGDGLNEIEHDDLGRLTRLVPSDPSKSPSWLVYDLQFRWSEVWIEDAKGTPTVIQRTEHDGLGRAVTSALRRAGSSGEVYEPGSFRHQRAVHDGVGTAWATSHWLSSKESDLPASFSTNADWEIITSVDPFGHVERIVASDGGLKLAAYRGDVWSQTVTLDSQSGGLARTFTRYDARGEVMETWEDKGAPSFDPPQFLTVAQMVPWRFVRGSYEKDVAGRLVAVRIRGRDATGIGRNQQRFFSYDPLGNLTEHTFPEHGVGNGPIAYEGFDALGKPKRVILSLDPFEARELKHDAAGRILESWSVIRDNRYLLGFTEYGSDPLENEVGKVVRTIRHNHLISPLEPCPDGCVPSDAIGVTHSYGYSQHGQLAGRTTEVSFGGAAKSGGSQTFNLGFEYDRWGNIDRIYYPELVGTPGCSLSSPTIEIDWDPVALASITDATTGQGLFNSPEYDSATGMLIGWASITGTLADSSAVTGWVRHEIEVDGTRPRPTRISASVAGSLLFESGGYEYDAAGNIRSIGEWEYLYDDLGRLVSANHASGGRSYSYDDFGNLVNMGTRAIGVEPSTNRLAGAEYDLRGNLTSETVPHGWTRHLRFDLDNQLVAAWATGPDAPAAQFGFAYDLEGERVLKYRVAEGSVAEATFSLRDQEGNVLTDFLWTPTAMGGTEGRWFRLADHVYLGRRPIIHRQSQGGYPVIYTAVVTDQLQSTRTEISDPDRSVAEASFAYWPFGEFAERQGTPAAKHLFTAHEREDTGTEEDTLYGLDYMHARYYSQANGRFIGLDPTESGVVGVTQSWNLYAYVRNNPIRYVDPAGLWLRDVHQHLTTYLAIKAGYDVVNARQIGTANVNVDRQRPPVPWRPRDFRLHFMTPEESVAYFQIRQFFPGDEYQRLGMALHSIQDSFSHSLVGWPLGHGVDNLIGQSPDDTWRYPDTALEMAEETFRLLGGNVEALDRGFLSEVFKRPSEAERTLMLLIEISRINSETTEEISSKEEIQ